MPSPSTEPYKYISAKRDQMVRMKYVGPNKILKGSTALVKLDGDKAMAQFDNKDRGRLCFGWHEFKASDFETLEPKYGPEFALRQAVNRGFRPSFPTSEIVMVEMEDLTDDRVKAMLAQKRALMERAFSKSMDSHFIHITAPTGAVPNV